ncbi:hypothetical protein [Pseudomonas oryzihabitans]|uniref:hypothetical protein n=1 Tax=Pseudomonas oryzihabitans TaxID=47885 RepID=UPI00142F240D|nr:hypothetical protein [Pseudomonas psychrotolerans]
MFLGFFIMAAGILALAEAIGLIGANVKWGIPLAITCFGASLIWEAIQKRKT